VPCACDRRLERQSAERRRGSRLSIMSQPATSIPQKLFFKIGEVCELAGVQAHVLRYWETEFPMLAPQKNRAGQRTYRRKDVEMALRIKELLYDEQYTIAGAKKKLATELRGPVRDGGPAPVKTHMRSLLPRPRHHRNRNSPPISERHSRASPVSFAIFWICLTRAMLN